MDAWPGNFRMPRAAYVNKVDISFRIYTYIFHIIYYRYISFIHVRFLFPEIFARLKDWKSLEMLERPHLHTRQLINSQMSSQDVKWDPQRPRKRMPARAGRREGRGGRALWWVSGLRGLGLEFYTPL